MLRSGINVLRCGTLLSVARECHSLNWERRRSATPFYQKERCGSGTPFLRAGAALFSPSFFLAFFFWRSFFKNSRFNFMLLEVGNIVFHQKKFWAFIKERWIQTQWDQLFSEGDLNLLCILLLRGILRWIIKIHSMILL